MTPDCPTGVKFRPSTKAVFAGLPDGGVLLDLDTKRYFVLNETGCTVWRRLEQGPATPRDLAESLIAEFETDVDSATADVRALIDHLQSEHLVQTD